MNDSAFPKRPHHVASGSEADTPTVITNSLTSDDTATIPRGPLAGFELIGEISRGGMGVVYRARQISADRLVALKVVRGSDPDSEEVERFLAEARAAARLNHPHIVPVYEVGEFGGQPFFSMRLIEGVSLSKHLNGKPLECREAAGLLCTVSKAIQFAHDHKIIHRDLKPGNILLDEGKQPYVTDFGLARITDKSSDLTKDGQVMGTPSYMPPEQALGQRDLVDVRSDVYSLGAVLYSCLTGRPPFQAASSMATVMQLLSRDVVPPRRLNDEVNIDLETICLKCLEKNPLHRYATAQDLADDLRRFLDGKPILARPSSRLEHLRKWAVRNPLVAGLSAVSLLVLLTLLVGGAIYQIKLTRALNEADASRIAARQSEADRTVTLYEALVKQAGFLNDLRPVGFGEQVQKAVAEARKLDTPARDLVQLRQLAVNGMGQATFDTPVLVENLGAIPQVADLTPDGRLVIIGLLTGEVAFLDRVTTSEVSRFQQHSEAVVGIRFPNDTTCYTYTAFCREVIKWRFDGEKWLPEGQVNTNKPDHVTDVRMSHDGRYFIGWTNWNPQPDAIGYTAGEVPRTEPVESEARSFFCIRPVDNHAIAMRVIPIIATTAFDFRNDDFAAINDGKAVVYSFSRDKLTSRFDLPELTDSVALEPNAARLVATGHSGAYVYSLGDTHPAAKIVNEHVYAAQFLGESSTINLCSLNQHVVVSLEKPSDRILLKRFNGLFWYSSCGRCRFEGDSKSDSLSFASSRPQELRLWNNDNGSVDDVSFSADGTVICCSCNYETVQLLDATSGTVIAEVPGRRGVLHPSGRWMAINRHESVHLFSLPDLFEVSVVQNSKRVFNRMRFSADGTHLVGFGWDQRNFAVFRMDVPSNESEAPKLVFLSDLDSEGNSACWSPGGNQLAWVSHDYKIKESRVNLRNYDTSDHRQFLTFHDLRPKFCSLISPTPGRLVLIDSENHLLLWDIERDKEVARSTETYRNPLSMSPDGRFLFSTQKLVSLDTLETVFELPSLASDPWGIDWSADGRQVVFGHNGGEITLWNLDSVHDRLSSLELDWPRCNVANAVTEPLAELSLLRAKLSGSSNEEVAVISMESADASQESIKLLESHLAKTSWEQLTSRLALTSDEHVPVAVDTMLQLSQNYPLNSEADSAETLVLFANGLNSEFATLLSKEEHEQTLQSWISKIDATENPTIVTKAVAAVVMGGYAHVLSQHDEQTGSSIEYYQRSEKLAWEVVNSGVLSKRTFGDRWFWFSAGHARQQEKAGNMLRAIALMQEALNSQPETGFMPDEAVVLKEAKLLIQWLHNEGRFEEKAEWQKKYPQLAVLLLPTNQASSWQHLNTGTAQSTITVVDDTIQFSVLQTSSEVWHAQFTQNPVMLEEGQTYHLRFDARSPESRSAIVDVAKGEPDYTSVGIYERFSTTPEFQSFDYTFEAKNIGNVQRISFDLGDETGTLIFRNVVLEKIIPAEQ